MKVTKVDQGVPAERLLRLETDEHVMDMRRYFTRWGAEEFIRNYQPLPLIHRGKRIGPSYSLGIEKRGFLHYEVVAYQCYLAKEEEVHIKQDGGIVWMRSLI